MLRFSLFYKLFTVLLLKNAASYIIISYTLCWPRGAGRKAMFGYVTPFMPELKVRDKELYQSWYCGLCRALGRYGSGSKLSLSYDTTFAAVLISGLLGSEPEFGYRACAMHPARGKTPYVRGDEVLSLCAGWSVLLMRYKLLDDARDGRPMRKAALPVFARGVKRARAAYPEAESVLTEGLRELSDIENKPECSVDEAPMLFGSLLGKLFSTCTLVPESQKPIVGELGRKLGGFIYTADAWDDRAEDEKRGSYNIFLRSQLADPRETCAAMLDMYINSAVLAYDLLDIRANKPLLDNIMYMGLARRAAEVLDGSGKGGHSAGKEDSSLGSV